VGLAPLGKKKPPAERRGSTWWRRTGPFEDGPQSTDKKYTGYTLPLSYRQRGSLRVIGRGPGIGRHSAGRTQSHERMVFSSD